MDGVRSSDSAVTCLVMLARFHGVAAQPEQIKHQLGDSTKAIEAIDILGVAKLLKLKARRVETHSEKLQDLPLPILSHHSDSYSQTQRWSSWLIARSSRWEEIDASSLNRINYFFYKKTIERIGLIRSVWK
ncbi:cysteine peptidase family C39 domain-containing protein [Endozoicomonas numazuensis]|uniref:Peptidase C39 domain-containing protein n=1 Tax=Endozoicomonas numazuensis TaxID=1137799 RepID=A0A081NHQ7_9GAMM|nr:cysteine peptidase family C39 domain-containing protein [Endozoicomonas numazuensis]KEQ17980.1 hypothetical protein GZ78_10235 [Endozoicomonas numazuensis]